MTPRPLPLEFYERETDVVAKDLLGKTLTHVRRGVVTSGRIVEVEAYLGVRDEASHTYRNRKRRSITMFGPAGRAYVYLSYGVHRCFNIVAHERESEGGILIRAVEPLEGIPSMKRRRGSRQLKSLTSGPGKLCQAFAIELRHDGSCLRESPITVSDGPAPSRVDAGPRIGISKAVNLPLRFVDADSEFLSR